MHYVYVLRCLNNKKQKRKLYVGCTDDLRARLQNHESSSVRSTKGFDKVELIYYEACRNKTDARKRELQLKTGFGRGYLQRRLKNDLTG